MKASLQLKMGQQLTMTPQLQQAIRLLQLSTLDLQQEIQEALDANPMLEMEEHDGDDTPDHSSMEMSESKTEVTSKDDSDTPELDEQWSQEQLPDDLPVDSQWDDTYQATAGVSSGNSNAIDDDFDYDSRHASTENLQDHLEWQLNLTPMSDADREIATMLIDGVDDDGYLHTTIEDVVESMDPELEIEEEEVLAVLHRLQQFDPA